VISATAVITCQQRETTSLSPTEKLLHSPQLRNYFTLPIQRSPHNIIPKLFLRKKEGAKQITFSTTPFSIAEEKVLDCQHGHN